jgi:acetyltransferase
VLRLGGRTRAELDDVLNGLKQAGANLFLVEAMASDGVDLVAGAQRDLVFGAMRLAGLDG